MTIHGESTARNAYKCGTGISLNAIGTDIGAILQFHQCVRGCSSQQVWVESGLWDVCPSNPFKQRILTSMRCPMETQRADSNSKTFRFLHHQNIWSQDLVQGCMELAEDHVVRGLGGTHETAGGVHQGTVNRWL